MYYLLITDYVNEEDNDDHTLNIIHDTLKLNVT